MKIFWFKVEGTRAINGIEVEDDNITRNGYVYGYGEDLESARRDAESGLEYDSLNFDSLDKEVERDVRKQWYKEIW